MAHWLLAAPPENHPGVSLLARQFNKPLGATPRFSLRRKKMQSLLTDEESRNKLLKELSKGDGGDAPAAPADAPSTEDAPTGDGDN